LSGAFAFAAFMGFATLLGGGQAIARGEMGAAVGLMVMLTGLIALAVGAGFFYLAYVKAPQAEATELRQSVRHPNQPWMLRQDWAQRRVVDRSSLAVVIFMAVWCSGWWGILTLLWSVNREKIIAAVQESWSEGAMLGFVVLGGVAGLLVLFGALRNWWRYGHATLAIDSLPGHLGDRFRASVVTQLASKPAEPIEVTLTCESVKWLKARGAGGRRTPEQTFDERWSESFSVEPGRLLTTRDGTVIPIDIPIPANQPECTLDKRGNGIRWMLSISGSDVARPAYYFQFEIPVYRRR
jgi:hypothetical protein